MGWSVWKRSNYRQNLHFKTFVDIDSPTMVAILTRQKKSVKDDAAEVKLPCAIIGYNITFLDVVQKRKLLSQKYFFNVHSEMLWAKLNFAEKPCSLGLCSTTSHGKFITLDILHFSITELLDKIGYDASSLVSDISESLAKTDSVPLHMIPSNLLSLKFILSH